jgi:hypothetical protein
LGALRARQQPAAVLPAIWTYAGPDRNPATPIAELAAASAARAREHHGQADYAA